MVTGQTSRTARIFYGAIFIFAVVVAVIFLLKETVTKQSSEAAKINLTFLRNVNGTEYVIFDGKNLGDTIKQEDIERYKHNKANYLFDSIYLENCLSPKNCWLPVVDGRDIAFGRLVESKIHIIYNGVDKGEGFFPQISRGHLAFYRVTEGKPRIIYDGEDLGEGERMVLKDGHLAFFRQEKVVEPFRVARESFVIIRDGEYIARDAYGLVLSGDDYAFATLRGGCFKPKESPNSSQCVPDTDLNHHIIFNGQDVGIGETDIMIADGHLVFYRFIDNTRHTILDGKDFGLVDVLISGGNVALLRGVSDRGHSAYSVTFNGKDLGIARGKPTIDNNSIAFERVVGDKAHIIYNARDIGEGFDPQLSGSHMAFWKYKTYTPFEFYKKDYEECLKIYGEAKCGRKSEKELKSEFNKLSEQEKKEIETSIRFSAPKVLIYDNKEVQDEVQDRKTVFSLLDGSFAYMRKESYWNGKGVIEDKMMIVFNGKNLGEGHDPILSREN